MMVVLVVLVHLGHLVQIALKAEGLEGRQDVLWIDRFPALLFADIVGLGRNNMDKLCLSAFAALRQRKNLPPPPNPIHVTNTAVYQQLPRLLGALDVLGQHIVYNLVDGC